MHNFGLYIVLKKLVLTEVFETIVMFMTCLKIKLHVVNAVLLLSNTNVSTEFVGHQHIFMHCYEVLI
jgi:hypothetical protein